MNIFFDLDGTLLDSRLRLYSLFQHLVPASDLSFDEYWQLKRSKIGHTAILSQQFAYTADQLKRFEKLWMTEIEEAKWMAMDQPFEGLTEYLAALKHQHKLFVVTARQSEKTAKQQIADLGWSEFFTQILVTEQKQEKLTLIQQSIAELTPLDWLVGDTGKDIQTGKQLHLKTAAVLSGFLSKESLIPYQPDVIVANVVNLDFEN